MMRIVCPNCGEEPTRGQRHVCRPPGVQAPVGGAALVVASAECAVTATGEKAILPRKGGYAASPGQVCASIASLVSKSPALWRSGGALARCGGEDFVAGLLALAMGRAGWHKDPKRELLRALGGSVADEAARALQEFWRGCLAARGPRRRTAGVSGGYQQLVLPPSRNRSNPRPSPLGRPEAPGRQAAAPPSAAGASQSASPGRGGPRRDAEAPRLRRPTPPALPSPRNKSNPRPAGLRAVPLNPIQAMKQRRTQKERDAEERQLQVQAQAEERRLSRCGGSDQSSPQATASVCSTGAAALEADWCWRPAPPQEGAEAGDPQHEAAGSVANDFAAHAADLTSAPSSPGQASALALRPVPGHGGGGAPPGGERRRERPAMPLVPRPVPPPACAASRACSTASTSVPAGNDCEVSSAPSTLQGWRPAVRAGDPPARPGSAAPASAPATARLQERLRRREGQGDPESSRGAAPPGDSGWLGRIEARKREVQQSEDVEDEHKQQVAERCDRRNDALRRVIDRQAQRRHDVDQLEA